MYVLSHIIYINYTWYCRIPWRDWSPRKTRTTWLQGHNWSSGTTRSKRKAWECGANGFFGQGRQR